MYIYIYKALLNHLTTYAFLLMYSICVIFASAESFLPFFVENDKHLPVVLPKVKYFYRFNYIIRYIYEL